MVPPQDAFVEREIALRHAEDVVFAHRLLAGAAAELEGAGSVDQAPFDALRERSCVIGSRQVAVALMVDDVVNKAKAAGGVLDPSPVDEYDFMYGRSFEDLDGHMWGVNWMDLEAAAKAMAKNTAKA